MNDGTLAESIARAMDCGDTGLVGFLPYILQDFFEIGSSAEGILEIVRENTTNHRDLEVLDLGCGKGAVLLKIAETLGCRCRGIDGIPEFVLEAAARAKEKGLRRCVFTTGDIREELGSLEKQDVIILGSVGPVLGDHRETMEKLKPVLKPGGIIVLDDGYVKDAGGPGHEVVGKKSDILRETEAAGMEIVREYVWDKKDPSPEYDREFRLIVKRCGELMEKHPDRRKLFEDYIRKQEKEYHALENDIVCSAMVISRRRE